MQTLGMLKLFVGGLASQTKLYRVKQGRERGSGGYFNKQYVFQKGHLFAENTYLHRIVCAVFR